MNKGIFVEIVGFSGIGCSTHIRRLKEIFAVQHGLSSTIVNSDEGSEHANNESGIGSGDWHFEKFPVADFFAAMRATAVRIVTRIKPALKCGHIVLQRHSSKSALATILAHGFENRINELRIDEENARLLGPTEILEPDLVVVLDASAKYVLEKQGGWGLAEESQHTQFARRQYTILLQEIERFSNVVHVAAERERGEVFGDIFELVLKLYKERNQY